MSGGGVCVGALLGALLPAIPADRFTLAWEHSIERVLWEEDYRVADGRLVLEEARVRGSGAGMEPPADAVLRDGWWVYRPRLAPLDRLVLSASAFTADHELCWSGACRPLKSLLPEDARSGPVVIAPCPDDA